VSPKHLKMIIVILIVAAVVAFVALRDREPAGQTATETGAREDIGQGVQSVVMVFADPEALEMIQERRDIVVPSDRAGRAKKILEELALGPDGADAAATIPKGTHVRSVFFDDAGGVTVDFSRELVSNHPGGSTGELMTIRSVVQTLASNFQGIRSVRFLVEGKEIETIAGHVDASVPFDVDQYR
jgi:germination protein M